MYILVSTVKRRSFYYIAGSISLLLLLSVASCRPVVLPEPPSPLSQVSQSYRAQADGIITLGEDLEVPGRVRLDYLVHPNNSVEATQLSVWIDDVDLIVELSWWKDRLEPLRCTSLGNEEHFRGQLEDNELIFPPGVEVQGVSYLRRDGNSCKGSYRRLEAKSNAALVVGHNPLEDKFSVHAQFSAVVDGNPITIGLDADGHYLNRPPIADFRAYGEGVVTTEDGCPGTDKGKPPIAFANSAEGLVTTLRSDSYDHDHNWPETFKKDQPRVDIAFEQWTRSRGSGFAFLGKGEEIGPLLFETGREHQVLLWVFDRTGAEARKFCHFQVVQP